MRLGTFRFGDGIPTPESAEAAYDQLDFHHGVDAYLNGLPAVSTTALRRGFLDAGVNDNDVLLFSRLMDAASLFLTANCDTVYFARQGLVHHPAPLQTHARVLRQILAAQRDRARRVAAAVPAGCPVGWLNMGTHVTPGEHGHANRAMSKRRETPCGSRCPLSSASRRSASDVEMELCGDGRGRPNRLDQGSR